MKPIKINSEPLLIYRAEDTVSAGFPSPAQDYEQHGNFDLNRYLIKNPPTTFMVRVASESMIGAGINKDDVVLVDRSLEPKSGDIIIAAIDNEFTLKRFMIENNEVWLQAENPESKNIYFRELQENFCWGVVTCIIRKIK